MQLRQLMNGWPLFFLLALPMTGAMLHAMGQQNLDAPEGVSHMIQYSVRWAVPFIYLVTAASALPVLYPSTATRWLQRNRRYIGLVFAVAMAWQGGFIFLVSTLHSDYYYAEIYFLRDELEGSSGYIFLTAMVFTSFRFGRRLLSPAQWKTLHRSGVYFLWAYPFSVYWWNLYYYGNPQPIDHIFYWTGFLAFAARIAAWGKRRLGLLAAAQQPVSAWERTAGSAILCLGVIAAGTGAIWQQPLSSLLLAPDWSATLELWLPYWPFEPFLPLMAIGFGTWLITGSLHPVTSGAPRQA